MRLWFLATVAGLAGALTGCLLQQGGGQERQDPSGKTFVKATDLGADALPYTKARLILAGTPVNVTMERSQKGAELQFDIKAGEEVLEVEHFIADETGFRFAGLSDEMFAPPIPVVRFPFSTSETWEWSGEASLGRNKKPAKAALSSAWQTVNLAGGVYECVVVTADLVVTADGTDSKRTLKFWIQPKKGIVKREFGFSSTREPRPAGES